MAVITRAQILASYVSSFSSHVIIIVRTPFTFSIPTLAQL